MLLGDQPHLDGLDKLGFEGFAEEIASLILDSRGSTPFTLGIEGAWGAGKSTLMGRLCARLALEDDMTVVMFNAWTADDDRVLEALVKTVLNELDPNVLRKALRNEKLVGWARVLLNLIPRLFGFGNVVDTFWDRVAADPRARNDLRKLVEQAVAQWQGKRSAPSRDRTLCVFVDDLDRCSPKGVIAVFEAMKLYLSVPGIIFVVGYDQGIVSDLVQKEKGYSSEAIRSRDYLEKFIQIVYRIPRPSPDVSDELVESLLASSGTAALFGPVEREIVIEGSASNPRRIKRFINGFVLAYGLDPRWRGFEPQALVRLQLLQMHFREFAVLLDRPSEHDPVEEFLHYREVRDALRRHDPGERTKIQELLKRIGMAAGDQENYDAVLGRLEGRVPVPFVKLIGREDFVHLMERIAASPGWEKLREALAEGVLPLTESPGDRSPGEDQMRRPRGLLKGLRLLWLDDEVERNRSLAESLTGAGVDLATEVNTGGARKALEGRQFDVLVSDISRHGNPAAGFEGLERLRNEVPSVPQVIFFTARITRDRLQRARDLGAAITNDPGELFEFLELTKATWPASPGDESGLIPASDRSSD